MKTSLVSLLFAFVLMASLSAQTMFNAEPVLALESVGREAAISFDETEYDMGQVLQGKPVSHTFTFTNTGNADLKIESVKPGCGCTVAEYTKESIAPGETGFITATYNAAGMGVFTKTISVKTNASETSMILRFKGEVYQ
ncbi:MAG: DUF1573 domain-containing protein [Bacteroidia bacterium]